MIHAAMAVYDVREFGATGERGDNAQTSIQRAVDACAAAGGGAVYFPPGAYTSGTIHLRSCVRVYLESGATLYSSKDPAHFDKPALFYGEDLQNLTLEGRGTVDGQAEYEWRLHDRQDWLIDPNKRLMEEQGRPLTRAFPTADSVGHHLLLIGCRDIRIVGLSFLNCPGWSMHLLACERLVIDGVLIRSSLKEGVWSDGIDPNGCKDVHISNCTIETGDDALVVYSHGMYGRPALPCENITVTNCRLSSASSAIKFCDCNANAIRNVTIDNCVITGSNRGIAFMVFFGGVLENVVISNVTVECKPFDWFWWGDGDPIYFNHRRLREINPTIDPGEEPLVGQIRNIVLRNVLARGMATSSIHGHPDAPLENITLDNVRLEVTSDPSAVLQKGAHALTVENARNLRLKDVEIVWTASHAERWRSALAVENVRDLSLDGVSARQAPGSQAPAIALRDIDGGQVRHCRAQQGTGTFLRLEGEGTREIALWGNDTHAAQVPVSASDIVRADALR